MWILFIVSAPFMVPGQYFRWLQFHIMWPFLSPSRLISPHFLFSLIFKFPCTMGENIRVFHIEIIHLIGCNITTVIVIIFTKNTFELLNQLISEIRTYLNSGTNSLMRSKPASEDKSPPSKFILICLCFLMIRCLQYS